MTAFPQVQTDVRNGEPWVTKMLRTVLLQVPDDTHINPCIDLCDKHKQDAYVEMLKASAVALAEQACEEWYHNQNCEALNGIDGVVFVTGISIERDHMGRYRVNGVTDSHDDWFDTKYAALRAAALAVKDGSIPK